MVTPRLIAGKEPGDARPLRPVVTRYMQLRNVVARRLVRLVRLAVDKRDFHFLRLVTMHYDHHPFRVIPVTYRIWQPGLKPR